jgi:hypothetical protein
MNKASCASSRARPGELLSLVAGGLVGSGLDVREGEDSRLAITCPGARCMLLVSDYGSAEWEYCPRCPDVADPGLAADMATSLLTGRAGPFPRLAPRSSPGSLTFKGIVGRELKARGLDVELAVYADEVAYAAFAQVVATAPGGDDDAQVHVADDGGLTWIRDYEAEAAIVAGPEPYQPADAAGVAAAVVAAVTGAMAFLNPPAARAADEVAE